LPRGWFGRGFWFGWGRGFGNPYPFCRWFPWLPRWWWAYPALSLLYYGVPWGFPYYSTLPYYGAIWGFPYYRGYLTRLYPYLPYRLY